MSLFDFFDPRLKSARSPTPAGEPSEEKDRPERTSRSWSWPGSFQTPAPTGEGRLTPAVLLKILAFKMAAPFFVIELAIMIFLHFALGPEIGWGGNFLDATLLTILATPLMYWWVVGPLSRTLAASDESRERFRALVESTSDWIWEVDAYCVYTYASPKVRDILGFTSEDVIGKAHLDFLAPDDRERAATELQSHTAAQRAFAGVENVVLHKNGRRVILETSAVPIFDLEGNWKGYRGVHRNVTQLKEAQQQALQTARLAAIGQMAAGLAHEGRSALQDIQIALETLTLDLEDQPAVREAVACVQEAVDRLRSLYDKIRGFSKPLELDKRRCDLEEIVQTTWTKLAPLRQGRKVHFHDDPGELDARIEADAFALEGVFRNLFENALQACHDPVEIEVLWSETQIQGDSAVEVIVRDNGPGITAKPKERIFDPFYTTKPHGSGLGLAISKRIVEAHGGRIAVGSHAPGLEIVITLPRGA